MADDHSQTGPATRDRGYAVGLAERGAVWWKRWLNVQAPYRWNLRRLDPGYTLDIGCGVGRNLAHLAGHGVGVDHNRHAVEIARRRGFRALTADEFPASPFNTGARFDSLLLSHVVEHMTESEAIDLLAAYLHTLKPGGKVIFITPQELGYRADPTHVQFMDMAALHRIARAAGLEPVKASSFPLPRIFGGIFKYNEFVLVTRKPQ